LRLLEADIQRKELLNEAQEIKNNRDRAELDLARKKLAQLDGIDVEVVPNTFEIHSNN
jgi:hypothetical protein